MKTQYEEAEEASISKSLCITCRGCLMKDYLLSCGLVAECINYKAETPKKVVKILMSMGDALVALKKGACVARNNWNGKGMFISLVKSCMVGYTDYLEIKSVDDIRTPWLASQTDILAEDWYVAIAAEGTSFDPRVYCGIE